MAKNISIWLNNLTITCHNVPSRFIAFFLLCVIKRRQDNETIRANRT